MRICKSRASGTTCFSAFLRRRPSATRWRKYSTRCCSGAADVATPAGRRWCWIFCPISSRRSRARKNWAFSATSAQRPAPQRRCVNGRCRTHHAISVKGTGGPQSKIGTVSVPIYPFCRCLLGGSSVVSVQPFLLRSYSVSKTILQLCRPEVPEVLRRNYGKMLSDFFRGILAARCQHAKQRILISST